jgi:hypothetical protein
LLPITGPLDGNLPNHHTVVEQMGLRFAAAKTYQKTWSLRNQTSRWLRTSKSVVPIEHLSDDQDDSQHPFGNPATTTCKVAVLGFASQPFDWFAFSRMMTLQAR